MSSLLPTMGIITAVHKFVTLLMYNGSHNYFLEDTGQSTILQVLCIIKHVCKRYPSFSLSLLINLVIEFFLTSRHKLSIVQTPQKQLPEHIARALSNN